MNKKILNLMLDIETIGTTVDSIILSFDFFTFELPGMDNQSNEPIGIGRDISVFSSLVAHRKSDRSTEDFWAAPEREAAMNDIMEFQKNAVPFAQAMNELYEFLNMLQDKFTVYYWGRGASTFDLPILSHAMRSVVGESYKEPWQFWQIMDVRSIVRFAKWCGLKPVKSTAGIEHTASSDVKNQIEEIKQAWCFINDLDYENI